jgi:replicative superfamily II helicase
MLVCAPTGAGKTDVAMLTILRTVSQYRADDGTIAKNDFKIVYVAPMKALAAEVVRKFSKRLGGRFEDGGLGLVVKELTGLRFILFWLLLFLILHFHFNKVICN